VVTVPEVPSIRDVDRVVGLLENYRVSVDGVVVNRLNQTLVRRVICFHPRYSGSVGNTTSWCCA